MIRMSYMPLMLVSFSIYVTGEDVKCNEFCLCKPSGFAICTGQELNHVPRFPENIQAVTMVNTNLTSIGESGFYNLTFNYIEKLNLTGNSITYIHPNAFENITNLVKFTVSKERNLSCSTLIASLRKMNKKGLRKLYFTNNKWTKLPDDMFASFKNSPVKDLFLTWNSIDEVNCTLFSPLSNLTTLDLTSNGIESVTVVGIPKIQHLILEDNKILKIPTWCDANKSLVPNLSILKLSNNFIYEMDQNDFRCLDRVRVLWLEQLRIIRIRNNIFANMPLLESLQMRKVGERLLIIQDFAFNSSSLKKLALTFTRFAFHGRSYNPKTIFAYCPNLRELDLSGNDLRGTYSEFQIMSQSLIRVTKLTLSQTRLLTLQKFIFTNMISLESLLLNENGLTHWNDSYPIFGNISLKYLNLRANKISIINETSFSPILLESLKRLDLSFNSFACTCDQMWFRNWISKTNISLVGYPKSYKCRTPTNMYGILLRDYKPTIDSCTPWNPLFTMAIVVSSTAAFILSLIFTIIKCQTNIKNRLYLFRVFYNRRQGYEHFENTDDYEYHAFVVYCDADRQWVHGKFLKRIEEEQGIKLCVHQRDFDVGETITGNIDKYLRKSWKVVVVMSNNFAKSEWCQWEVDVVQERRRRHGKDVFLLIMLKNINSKHMTSQLRTLLDSAPHLRYQTGVGEELFWKAAIETLRKPLGHPPVAVL